MNVKIVTWNMGKSSRKKLDWASELDKWTCLHPIGDVFFFTIQEATKNLGEVVILNILKNRLPDYEIAYKGRGTDLIGLSYYVYGYLCVRRNLSATIINRQDDVVCLYKKKFCTKSSLGFGLIVGAIKLIFVCSHLPIDLSDTYMSNYGYIERIDAMRTIKTDIITKLKDVMGEPTTVFWAGDLNFRVQIDGVEQLEHLMNRELGDYNEAPKDFLQTSKFVEYDPDKSGFRTFMRKRNSPIHAYSLSRIPSYCDRIIYKGHFKPAHYYSWPPKNQSTQSAQHYPMSIAYSDHEPVILEGFVVSSVVSPVVSS
jgi:hypothetical protein